MTGGTGSPGTLLALRTVGVLAVLRAPSADAAVRTTDALVAGGVTGIEVTYSTPDAPEAIAEIRRRHGDGVLLGAGTVLTAEHAREAVDAGASFLVSPGTEPALVGSMLATGVPALTGALTPSEVMAAVACGVQVVKLFPASLGGPAYLRALRGPFPDVALMPTGGVSADNLGEWFAAGAVAVGAGSDLCPPAAVRAGDWAAVTALAAGYAAALARVRDGSTPEGSR